MIWDWNEMKKTGEITHFLCWQMSSRGSLMRRPISILQWRLVPIVWSMRSAIHPLKKGHFLLRCDCAIPLLILERMMVRPSLLSLHWTPVFFTVPQTESCKSIESSERSTGFGCDNDLRKTTNGERVCLTHTHTHTHWCTIHTSLLQASWAISTLISALTPSLLTPILCQLQIEVAAPVIMWNGRGRGGAAGWHCQSCLKPG